MSDAHDGPDLRSLYSDREPDPDLEARVVDDWRRLTRGGRAETGRGGRALRVAAAVALLAAGWGAGRLTAPPGGDGAPGAAYMLLLWEGATFEPSEDPGGHAPEYVAWARTVASAGVPIDGEELGGARSWIGPGGASGTPVDAGELRLGGYFIVGVGDSTAAVELAREHPHVRHGGWVEVAPLATREPAG